MESIFVADIGGTHFSAGLFSPELGEVRHVRKLVVADYSGPDAAVTAYFKQIAAESGAAQPSRAAFALATPIIGDYISFTNSAWSFSIADMQRKLGLQRLQIVNDFEALALSLPFLKPAQFRAHAALPSQSRVMAVLGPGTGLGVASICPLHGGAGNPSWRALPGEGGHATLAAANEFESDILKIVRTQYGHVSAERILSGIGLPLLYQAIARVNGQNVPEMATPAIVQQGLAPVGASLEQKLAEQTLATFCAMLGSFAGNVALTVGAQGGLFIGGGIIPRLGDYFFASAFRQRFEAKGRFESYLKAIPTALITDPLAALSGAARCLDVTVDP